jgi:predicted  nucleic acid-binding Zn-ribbon protein
MSDWLYVMGGGIVLLWLGAWLLLHLGNFEQRISQMRMTLEVRMGAIEKQFTAYNKFFADNERASQLTYSELSDIKSDIAELKTQLDEVKRAINVLEVAVNDLKLRSNARSNLRIV